MDGGIPHCSQPGCEGVIKPGIVFYGESLSQAFHHMAPSDMSAADLVIVMGTSLRVAPFSMLLHKARPTTARLLLNMEMISAFDHSEKDSNYRDVAVLGDVQASVATISQKVGWDKELRALIGKDESLATKRIPAPTSPGDKAEPSVGKSSSIPPAAATSQTIRSGAATKEKQRMHAHLSKSTLKGSPKPSKGQHSGPAKSSSSSTKAATARSKHADSGKARKP